MAMHPGFTVSSTSFEDGARIDTKYTKYGDDISPQIAWSGEPDGTVEFAVICHDPDAPMPWYWDHWTVTGIPADVHELPEGSRGSAYQLGATDFDGAEDYGGPGPPPGHGTHHYFWWVYALDTNVTGNPTRREFLERHGDNILAQERLVCTYSKAAD